MGLFATKYVVFIFLCFQVGASIKLIEPRWPSGHLSSSLTRVAYYLRTCMLNVMVTFRPTPPPGIRWLTFRSSTYSCTVQYTVISLSYNTLDVHPLVIKRVKFYSLKHPRTTPPACDLELFTVASPACLLWGSPFAEVRESAALPVDCEILTFHLTPVAELITRLAIQFSKHSITAVLLVCLVL